jgi:hypothetical protein
MGHFAGYLLPHCYVDESPHRANVYFLDLDYALQPSVYEREPRPSLD